MVFVEAAHENTDGAMNEPDKYGKYEFTVFLGQGGGWH